MYSKIISKSKAEFISLFSFIFFHTRETGGSPLEGQ